MRSLKILAICFLLTDTTNSLEKTIKQLIADSSRWIVQKNDQNAIISKRQPSGSAAVIINLLDDIMQILNTNRSNSPSSSQNTGQAFEKLNWNLKRHIKPINAMNDFSQKSQPLAHLDTGGSNFDRFIISERKNDNPILDWIIGKFSKRGLDWSSGNLRLVNVQGNSILGSDLIVHDRSIEIPLKQWLYILNPILKPKRNYI